MLLADSELLAKVTGETPIVGPLDLPDDPYASGSPVQPCSIDLRIGEVFDPRAKPGKPGSNGNPRKFFNLEPGGTAVITTFERCDLPANIAAIGFTPNSVSSQGILMTNPGHVDPGYRGTMTFTVINMSSEDYPLVAQEKIVTLLFFKLDPGAHRDFHQRGKNLDTAVGTASPEVQKLLSVLSADFLNISNRVAKAANAEEQKTRRWSLVVPILAAVLTGAAAFFTLQGQLQGEITDVKAETRSVADVDRLEQELAAMRRDLHKLDASASVGNADGGAP